MNKTFNENQLSKLLVDIFYCIHYQFGPGLFERVYEELICYELNKIGIEYTRQQEIKLIYEELDMGVGYRADLIIENKVIVELKSVDELSDIHYKQLLTYLKLADCKLGLLVNFNVALIKNGIHRVANGM